MTGEKPAITVGERLAQLQRTVHPPGRRPYTLAEIAEGIFAAAGVRVSEPYLSQLMAGKKDNPSAKLVAGIAQFFGVSIDSFYDHQAAADQDEAIRYLAALADDQVRAVALRLHELSPAALSAVAAIVDELKATGAVPNARSKRQRAPQPGEMD